MNIFNKVKVINLKSRIIVINNIKIIYVLLIAIIFIAFLAVKIMAVKNVDNNIGNNIQEEQRIEKESKEIINTNANTETDINNKLKIDFPTEIERYKSCWKSRNTKD